MGALRLPLAWLGVACAILLPRPAHATNYKVKIDTSPAQATVYIDGKESGVAGYTPLEVRLSRGEHTLVLELPGYKPLEVPIAVRPRAAFKFVLERAARPATLDVRGADDSTSGATVAVDGKPSGQVPIAVDVPAGRHEVVVTRDGYNAYREWVDAQEGERRTMVIVLAHKQQEGGQLLVTADAPGAEVWVDGARRDLAPAIVSNLPPGPHVVEVRKDGGQPWRQEVIITAGQSSKVVAQVAPAAPPPPSPPPVQAPKQAMLKMGSAVPDVEIFLDGGSIGRAPVSRLIDPGHHVIVAQKTGFAEYKREIDVQPGQSVDLVADLKAQGGVKVIATPSGAQVLLDGVIIGNSPASLPDVQSGDHVLEVKAAGYYDYRQTIRIEGGKHQVVTADLKQIPTGPTGAQLLAQIRGQTSQGGRAVKPGSFTGDVAVGYPYFVDARLTSGVWAQARGMNAIDGGIEIRTFGQFTDIAAQGKFQFLALDPLYMAVTLDAGGGGGPNGRNTFFGDAGLGATLSFDNIVSFSARSWLSLWTDRFCPAPDDTQTMARSECGTLYMRPDGSIFDPRSQRDNGARLYMGAWLDVTVDDHLSVFASFYGAPFQEQRIMFRGTYNGVFWQDDQKTYGQLGVTVKY
jgi:hypothetical protein